ncbi:MAG: hypothetical protein U0Y82_13890 [Thermoleophilia bacterium]
MVRWLRPLVAAELIKLGSLRTTWLLAASAVCVSLGIAFTDSRAAVAGAATWTPAQRAAFEPVQATLGGLAWAQVAFALVGILALSGEFGTGTIQPTLLAVPRRGRMLLAKVVVVAGTSLLVAVPLAFCCFLLGRRELVAAGVQASLADPGVLRAVVAAGVITAAVAVLGLCLAAILRHAWAAVAALVAVYYLAYGLARSLAAWTTVPQRLLLTSIGDSLTMIRPPRPPLSHPATASLLLVGHLAVGLLGAALAIRRDVS